jgi:hypothetical protein
MVQRNEEAADHEESFNKEAGAPELGISPS